VHLDVCAVHVHGHPDGSLVFWLDFVTCASSVLCLERVWCICVGTDCCVRLLSLCHSPHILPVCVCLCVNLCAVAAVAAVVASLDPAERGEGRVP
jgi:hypothetical protein